MEYYWYVTVFLFGTIIGSFLNVVIYRLHTGKSTAGRSHCLSCGETLKWYELVPLVSYLALRGTCRTCAAHIPLRYFLVELFTGASFVFLWWFTEHNLALFGFHAVIASLLIVIFVYDVRHMIIPDEMVVFLTAASLVLVWYRQGSLDALFVAMLSGLGMAAFFGAFWLVSRGRWMGLGDAKLAFPLGVLLGPIASISAVVLSFWIGAAVSLLLLALQKLFRAGMSRTHGWVRGKTRLPFSHVPLRMKSEIPFAPFLILGFLSAYYFHVDIFTNYIHIF